MGSNLKRFVVMVFDGKSHFPLSFRSQEDVENYRKSNPDYVLTEPLTMVLFARK